MTGPEQPDEAADPLRRLDPVEARRRDPAIDDLLGPAGTTDPRAALIRTDPGRHAANRGPAFGPDDPPMLLRGGPVLPAEVAASWGSSGTYRIPASLIHRCPEPEPSRDGWWFAVGLGTGVVVAGLLLLVVSLW